MGVQPLMGPRGIWVLAAVCAASAMIVPAAFAAPGGKGLQEEKDVVYGTAGGQELKLDVCRPANQQGLLPAVLFVHGGGWSGGDKRDFTQLAAGTAGAGYVTFNANYRLVANGKNTYPAALDDVQRAVRWIRANADRYQVDPERIGALGASAGGHLVALLGTRDTRHNSDKALAAYSSRVTCVVDLFGPTDLTAPFPRKAWGTFDVQALVEHFLGGAPADLKEQYREASSLFQVDKKTVPFLIFHGTADPLVPLDQSQRLDEALRKAGIESKLIIFEGEGHGFAKRENQDAFAKATLEFLNRHLKR